MCRYRALHTILAWLCQVQQIGNLARFPWVAEALQMVVFN